jgi:hypothetical protein
MLLPVAVMLQVGVPVAAAGTPDTFALPPDCDCATHTGEDTFVSVVELQLLPVFDVVHRDDAAVFEPASERDRGQRRREEPTQLPD